MSVSKTSSPFHSQVPAPGFSGGSVQFTAGQINIRHFFKENLQGRHCGHSFGTSQLPSERQVTLNSSIRLSHLGKVAKNTKHLLISLKVGVVRFTAVADTGVEVCWRSVPDEHYLVPFRRLKQILWRVFANEGLHLEGRGIAPRHKSPVCQFLSMFGSNCIPSTLNFD